MNPYVRACVAELVGTFTLTFIGCGAIIAGGGLVAVALAHGLALSMAVYATNGHINPAVTLAMLATGRIKASFAGGYIIAQCAGAIIAAVALVALFPASSVAAAKLGATLGTPENMAALGAKKTLFLEAILTFFLLITIFGVAVDKRAPKNVYGFAIGLTICMDILAAGPLTGASMNPARSLGPALVGGYWDFHFAYWMGPILGALTAAYLYDFFFLQEQAAEGRAA